MTATPQSVLDFWFGEAGPERWFVKDPAFDALVGERLGKAHDDAVAGAYDEWTETADGALALCILLDQVPRNLFRDSARGFASDAAALAVARDAVARGLDQAPGMTDRARLFLYTPFMHSEDLADQEQCVSLFAKSGSEGNHGFAVRHRDIIARFGRFPHRNAVLGRESSEAELAFLREPGSSF
jgi:uncharacterized protein (DUF924 family)